MTVQQRGPLRQLAEVRGWVGRIRRDHRDVTLRTHDGEVLVGSYLPGPLPVAPAVLVAHGFAAHRHKPAYARLADGLASECHVLTLDLRGHGGSSGRSTFGADERWDVAAGVDWLEAVGHRVIVPVGVSMGGTAVLGALADGVATAGAVTISTGAYRGRVRRPGIADLDAVVRSPFKRRAWQWLAGFRFASPERLRALTDPAALAVDVPVPTLVVHGEDDDYFPPSDAEALAEAIPAPVTVWHEPAGFGHAETGFDTGFIERLRAAIVGFAASGRFPDRTSGPSQPVERGERAS